MSMMFFLPNMLLSGFMFPFLGMPGWAQAIGEWLPLTHYHPHRPRHHAQGLDAWRPAIRHARARRIDGIRHDRRGDAFSPDAGLKAAQELRTAC